MSHPVDGSDQKELPLMHPQACELSPTHLMDAPFDVLWCFSHHGGIQNPWRRWDRPQAGHEEKVAIYPLTYWCWIPIENLAEAAAKSTSKLVAPNSRLRKVFLCAVFFWERKPVPIENPHPENRKSWVVTKHLPFQYIRSGMQFHESSDMAARLLKVTSVRQQENFARSEVVSRGKNAALHLSSVVNNRRQATWSSFVPPAPRPRSRSCLRKSSHFRNWWTRNRTSFSHSSSCSWEWPKQNLGGHKRHGRKEACGMHVWRKERKTSFDTSSPLKKPKE